jgi:predicted ferric reductase
MCLVVFLLFTSISLKIKKALFELFCYVHHLALLHFPLLMLHGIGCFLTTDQGTCLNPTSYKFVIAGFSIYLLERMLRLFRSLNPVKILKVIKHPSKVLEIQFRKFGFVMKPGQHVFIKCPDISYFQSHPFTLTSAPEEQYASVHIRIVGDWTASLAKRMHIHSINGTSEGHLINMNHMPKVYVDGPYGSPAEDVFKYEIAILVGAGIGVTPFASILKCKSQNLSNLICSHVVSSS